MRKRPQPLRSCVVCGAKGPKQGLVRIVAARDAGIVLDHTGKTAGRGAYVCGEAGCRGVGLQRKRLEYALRTEISESQWRTVVSSIDALAKLSGEAK